MRKHATKFMVAGFVLGVVVVALDEYIDHFSYELERELSGLMCEIGEYADGNP